MKPRLYIAINTDGTFDAFVSGKGFRANVTIESALRYLCDNGGLVSGDAVPIYNRAADTWSEQVYRNN